VTDETPISLEPAVAMVALKKNLRRLAALETGLGL
jgi:hypothetical protein